MLYSQIMQYTCFVLFNDEEDTARPNSLNISELHWCFMHGLDLRFGVGLNAALREEPVQSRCALKCGLTHGGKCWTRSVHGRCAPRLSSLGFIQVDQRLMVLFEVLTSGVLFIMASYFRNFFLKLCRQQTLVSWLIKECLTCRDRSLLYSQQVCPRSSITMSWNSTSKKRKKNEPQNELRFNMWMFYFSKSRH